MQVSLGLVLGLGLGMVLAQDVIPASTSARVVSLLEPIGTAWINALLCGPDMPTVAIVDLLF